MSEKHDSNITYPYIPNSAPGVRSAMLADVGVSSVDEFFEDIPDELRIKSPLNIPKPLLSERSLKRHISGVLSKNRHCDEFISFLGAGCYQHHVPAVCDEINSRSEFLTAYAGEPYDDHGRFQALFEAASMLGELLEMDVVNVPTYDSYQAAATALRMAARMSGRKRLLVSRLINPDKLSKILDYTKPELSVHLIGHNPETGQVDLQSLESALDEDTAAFYFENPCYLGPIETGGQKIADMLHKHGAQCIVGVDPISLGVLTPPAQYGADIVCGDLQPLGMHMSFGGGHAGFIATRDEERYVMEYPSRLFGIAPTSVEGEYGFGDVAYERTSFAIREEGKEWVGTAAALWGITAGVYLALMGPKGMQDIGTGIMQRVRYAMDRISAIEGVRCPVFTGVPFREFIVDFSATGKTVAQINAALYEKRVFGGRDLSAQFSDFQNCSLYCVTEIHTQEDMDMLVHALREVLK